MLDEVVTVQRDASSYPIRVTTLRGDSGELRDWQEFVDTREDAGALHHAAWFNVLQEAYRVKPFFLLARNDNGSIVGVMPCYHSSSIFTGPHYTTLEGGMLAEPSAQQALLDAAKASLKESHARYLQIRGGYAGENADYCFDTVQTVVPTAHGAEAAWQAVKPKTRWAVRQAEKDAVSVTLDPRQERLDDFYALYAARMRQLGTPTFAVATLRSMRKHLGADRLRLYMVRYRNTLVGGMLCVVHGKRWTDLYAIVLRELAPEFANYLLYATVIRDAADNGVAEVNLGRSTLGSGVHLFKRKWGGADIRVPYVFYSEAGQGHGNFGLLSETRGKGLRQVVWSKLPLSICNYAGPLIRRDLPFL